MSIDPSVAAHGRVDAATDEPAPPAAAAPSDLADLAAAIARLEALIAADAAPGLDGSAAVERIADIAFVLHEREVEASLCDALDEAVREISDCGLIKSASTQRTQEAAALLRDLSRRVNDLMALTQAKESAEPAAMAQASPGAAESEAARFDDGEGAADADEQIPEDLFAPDVPEDDEFARVVATLAGSLTLPSDQAEAVSNPLPEAAAVAGQLPGAPQSVETMLVTASGDTVISSELLSEPLAPPNEANDEPAAEQSSADATLAEEIVREQASSDVVPAPLPSPLAAKVEPILSEAASNDTASNETASNEAMSKESVSNETTLNETASSETVSAEVLPSADLSVDSAATALSEDSANVSSLGPPPPDVTATPDMIATASVGENLSPASPQAVANVDIEPALPVLDALADHEDTAQRDGESAVEMFVPDEPEPHSPVEANNAAAITDNADEILEPIESDILEPIESDILAPVEPAPPRTFIPEALPAIDPDEDPGDLFEPMPTPVTAPMASTVTAKIPSFGEASPSVAAPPEPVNVAVNVETTPPPTSDGELKPVPSAQAAAVVPDNEARAPTPVATPDIKPQAQPATVPPPPPPRPAQADPLAPVRALSEEEMIALFS